MTTSRLRLGQLLVDAGMITQDALDDVLAAQREDGRRLGTLLVERGHISEVQLTQILSHQLSIPWVSLHKIEFSRHLLNLVPRDQAERYCLLPIFVRRVRGQGDTLYIAMDDPSNEEALKASAAYAGLPVRPMIAPPSDIRSAIKAYYGLPTAETMPPPADAATAEVPVAPRAPDLPDAPAPSTDPAPTQPESALVSSDPPADLARVQTLRSALQVDTDAVRAEPVPAAEPVTMRESSTPPPPPSSVEGGEAPRSEERPAPIPTPRGKAPRMVSLTLLDGTTITLPARQRRVERARPVPTITRPEDPHDAGARMTPTPPDPTSHMTARDLVAALQAVSDGADASAILGDDARWETMFAALLSLLLKKQIIADWEFVDELRRLQNR